MDNKSQENIGRLDQQKPMDHTDRSWLSKLGPGLITGAADDDPSGIAT